MTEQLNLRCDYVSAARVKAEPFTLQQGEGGTGVLSGSVGFGDGRSFFFFLTSGEGLYFDFEYCTTLTLDQH